MARIYVVTETDLSEAGGPVAHLVGLARALVRLGHEVEMFAPGLGRFAGALPFRVRYLLAPRVRYLGRAIYAPLLAPVLFLRCLFRRPDVLYVRVSYHLLAPVLVARILRLTLVAEVNGIMERDLAAAGRSRPVRRWVAFVERATYRAAARVVAVTEGVRDFVVRERGASEAGTLALPNAADDEALRPLDRAECRRALDLPTDAFVVGYAGSFLPYEGLDVLLDAFARFAAERADAELVLAGHGPEEAALRARAGKEDLAGCVRFTGPFAIGRTAEIVSSFDVAVACPRPLYESHSLIKLHAAMACGVPVAASRIPGMDAEALGAGLSFEPGDADALADALRRLADDPEARARMGRTGRRLVEERFNWREVARKTLEGLV